MKENIKALTELCDILFVKEYPTCWQNKYAQMLGELLEKHEFCIKNKNFKLLNNNKIKLYPEFEFKLTSNSSNPVKEELVSGKYPDINNVIEKYIKAKEEDMKIKKYRLLKSSPLLHKNTYIYKIEALKDFIINGNFIHKGDIGGYIESEDNLCQNDYSWICKDSIVSGKSKVINNSFVGIGVKACINVVIDNTSIIRIPNKSVDMSFDKTIIIRNNAQLINCDVQGDFIFINDSVKISDSKIYGEQIRIIRNPIINTSTIRDRTLISDNCFIEHAQIIKSIINDDVEIYNECYIIDSHISESVWLDKAYISTSQIKGNQKIQNITLYKYIS